MDTETLHSPSAVRAMLSGRLPRFLALHAIPVAIIAVTIVCEYSVRSAKSAAWLEGSDLQQMFHLSLLVARLLAAGMALATWTWFAGAMRVEDTPSVIEAVHTGWSSCVRVVLAGLPLLLLSVLYVFVVCSALRLGTLMFTPVGSWAIALWATFVLACALPPCLVLIARFALLVPLTVFEQAPPLPALGLAGARMPLRAMNCLWFMLVLHALAMLACVLLPSWCYVNGMWTVLGSACGEPRWILTRQLIGLALFTGGAPVACASMASLYFILLPQHHE